MQLIGEPSDSHGYMIWSGDTTQIAYYRYTISERVADTSGINEVIVERGEIWDRQYMYVAQKYWHSDERNGEDYAIRIQGVNSSGIDVQDEDVFACPGCGGFNGCYWECISSHYAYRIQQNGGYEGFNTFNYELTEARDEQIDGSSVMYYEWFSSSEFFAFIADGGPGDFNFRGMSNFGQFQWDSNNFITFPANSGSYYNGYGQLIVGDIYGIKKGLGPWYYYESDQVFNYAGDKCDMPGDQGQATFEYMRDFMNNELDLSQNLQCSADLGQGGYVYPDNPDYEKIHKTMGTVIGGDPDFGDDDDDDGDDDDGGIIVSDNNWELYVSEMMNFTVETYSDTSLRYSDMLMEAQLFTISKLGSEGYEPFFAGNYTTFADSSGLPNMPVIDFSPGLYKFTFKRTGYAILTGVFEVRERFVATLPHKDFFSATIYPNPNTNPHFFIDVETTARLWVRYEIFDSNANEVFEYTIQLPKDHDGTHRIEPDVPLPNGFLYHRFSFLDGSSETITTIKN